MGRRLDVLNSGGDTELVKDDVKAGALAEGTHLAAGGEKAQALAGVLGHRGHLSRSIGELLDLGLRRALLAEDRAEDRGVAGEDLRHRRGGLVLLALVPVTALTTLIGARGRRRTRTLRLDSHVDGGELA